MSSPHDTITTTKIQLRRFKVSTAILSILLVLACAQLLRDIYIMSLLEEDIQLVIELHNQKNHDLRKCHILLGGTP